MGLIILLLHHLLLFGCVYLHKEIVFITCFQRRCYGSAMYKILLEENAKNNIEGQRSLNHIMMDVVKKEIIKWLNACIIYLIFYSVWVSLIQCVSQKGGMIIFENEKNELIRSRVVTGWRICMNYIKLTKVTRNDHFRLSFIDKMLDRLSGKEFYCFLMATQATVKFNSPLRSREEKIHMFIWNIFLQKNSILDCVMLQQHSKGA